MWKHTGKAKLSRVEDILLDRMNKGAIELYVVVDDHNISNILVVVTLQGLQRFDASTLRQVCDRHNYECQENLKRNPDSPIQRANYTMIFINQALRCTCNENSQFFSVIM
jgi:hypothetical protein